MDSFLVLHIRTGHGERSVSYGFLPSMKMASAWHRYLHLIRLFAALGLIALKCRKVAGSIPAVIGFFG
jgi:hypothetical protein